MGVGVGEWQFSGVPKPMLGIMGEEKVKKGATLAWCGFIISSPSTNPCLSGGDIPYHTRD